MGRSSPATTMKGARRWPVWTALILGAWERQVLRGEHVVVIRESLSAVAANIWRPTSVSVTIGKVVLKPGNRATHRNGYRPRRRTRGRGRSSW